MATGLDNLWIYKLAEDLEVEVYEITKKFPKSEFYRSIDQLRRSSAGAANNIAEAYHKTTVKEKIRFLDIASGEAEETKRNLIKSQRKGFITQTESENLIERYTILLKGLSAYKKFLLLNSSVKTK